MASANCESPLRRFAAKENTPKANSPVEVNRLKTLLRKKVGDVSVQGSPKKATPRKEVKVKRDKTMKLCSSCVHHNKDVCSSPVITEGQVAKKKRATKKDAAEGSSGGQGENSNSIDGTVEKKAAVKKPRETKKKPVTQEEKLDGPSTSGTVQSQPEGSVLTDSGTQVGGNSKPKRQRKKVEQSTEQNEPESLAGKGTGSKSKSKDIIKVKVLLPKKTTKISSQQNETAPFQNMDVTDLANSEMQGAAEKIDGSIKSKGKTTEKMRKVKFETTADIASARSNETIGDPEGSSAVKEKGPTKTKTKNNTKSKASQSKKSAENVLEDDENMLGDLNVTDLVDSINLGQQKRERNEMDNGAGNTKSNSRVMIEVSVSNNSTIERTSVSVDQALDNPVELSSDADKTASKSKGKSNDSKIKGSRPKKTDKNLPEDNEIAPFKNMNVTDLVNSTGSGKGSTEKRSTHSKDESKRTVRRNTYTIAKGVSTDSQIISVSQTLNNPTASTNNNHKELAESEDMFKDNSVGTIEEGIEEISLISSEKTVQNKENSGNSSSNMYCTQGDITHDPIATILTPALASALNNPLDETIFDFYVDTNGEVIYPQKLTETSAGDKINLSSSTTLSRHDASERSSINLDNVDDGSRTNIHDEDIVDRLRLDSFITVRPRIVGKYQSDLNQKNTRSKDGISNFTQEDSNDDTLNGISDHNDENQQPSTPDIEMLTHIKSERENVSMNEKQKHGSNSKSKQLESPVKNIDMSEPEEKKSKKSKKDAVLESPKKSTQKSAEKPSSDEEPESSQAKLKLKRNDEELCEKHKKSKDCDEKVARRSAKKKSKKQLKVDMKVAKAMESMSKHFSRMSVGTTIGTINKLHIGKLTSESDSSDECPSDCSCNDSSCESNSSGDECKCWKCLMERSDSSCSCDESSTSEDESNDESSSSESSSSAASPSPHEPDNSRRSMKKYTKEKKIVKPSYKDKLSKFCSKYDLRSNACKYELRSKDFKK